MDIPEPGEVYVIPHQAVIRKQAASTRLRIVFDASSKVQPDLVSLNDCLWTGPSLMPAIMNVLIRFRAWKYGLAADVRKAFYQIRIDENQRNFIRFLWVQDIQSDNPKLLILRFQRIIFGVNSSLFLLNGTLEYHWWPAGYRGPPKIFRYTGKILPVASLLQSAFSISISGQH